jgi:imidazolonepropionase-like amidohydrolase
MVRAISRAATTATNLNDKDDNVKEESSDEVMRYWEEIQPRSINAIAFHHQMSEIRTLKRLKNKKERYNPYEGDESARQLNEPVSNFLKRLPPLESAAFGPWLWCANPYAEVRHNPEEESSQGIRLAADLLITYDKKKENIKATVPDISPAALTRNLKPDRDRLREGILEYAKRYGMTCGKVGNLVFSSDELKAYSELSGCYSQTWRMFLGIGKPSSKPS